MRPEWSGVRLHGPDFSKFASDFVPPTLEALQAQVKAENIAQNSFGRGYQETRLGHLGKVDYYKKFYDEYYVERLYKVDCPWIVKMTFKFFNFVSGGGFARDFGDDDYLNVAMVLNEGKWISYQRERVDLKDQDFEGLKKVLAENGDVNEVKTYLQTFNCELFRIKCSDLLQSENSMTPDVSQIKHLIELSKLDYPRAFDAKLIVMSFILRSENFEILKQDDEISKFLRDNKVAFLGMTNDNEEDVKTYFKINSFETLKNWKKKLKGVPESSRSAGASSAVAAAVATTTTPSSPSSATSPTDSSQLSG